MVNRRGQFFLLAAVIISAVIISLGASTNRVLVSKEPEGFYDFGYAIQRELGAVLNYAVYNGSKDNANLEEFVDVLAEEIREKNIGTEFIFIFGRNASDMKLKNYGFGDVVLDGRDVEGTEGLATSRICLEGSCQILDKDIKDFSDLNAVKIKDDERVDKKSVLIEVSGTKFEFPFSDHQQVIFIMEKKVGGDRYILVR